MSVIIGNRTYPVVKIGTQYWLAENLDYRPSGAIFNGSGYYTYAACWYYGLADSAPQPKYGLLYNYFNHDDIVAPEGWHVPSKSEFETLVNFCGGMSVAGKKLKATSGWSYGRDEGGTDDFGFAALPAGYYNGLTFHDDRYSARFLCSTEYYNKVNILRIDFDSDSVTLSSTTYEEAFSIRLVKNEA